MNLRVLITCPQLQTSIDEFRQQFKSRGIDIDLPPVVQRMSEEDLTKIIGPFDGMIAGDDQVTARVFENAPKLRVVAKWGVGLDAIDLEAAAQRGVLVLNTPGAFADEVADVVMGYTILLLRGLHKLDAGVRDGAWPKLRGQSLRHKTLGIVGMGSIGRAVVNRAISAGMLVLGNDTQTPPKDFLDRTGLEMLTLERLLERSDIVSLNCPLTSKTRHMINDEAFRLMRPGIFLINTSRGPLIDEKAMVAAILDGKVAGAALDVFEDEPLPLSSPLRSLPQLIFGSHNASNTAEAVDQVNQLAISNLFKGLGVDG